MPPRAITAALVMAIITSHSTSLKAQTALSKTTVAYREVDGHRILVDILRPPGDAECPLLVWIHGGALIMGHREGIHPKVRALAESRGYAIASIDYRLAPETKLPALISDIEAAFEWLASDGAERFHLDTDRMVVAGGSAGGYLTLITGYRVQPRPKALVAFYGYGDLVGDWYSTPSPHPRHNARKISREEAEKQTDGTVVSDARQRNGNGSLIYNYYRQNGLWPRGVSGFDPDTIATQIAPYEPVRNVTREYPPTLLIHGTSDTDVPFEQSTMMADELKRHDISHRLIPITGGEHGFRGGDPKVIEDAYAVMRQFITENMASETLSPFAPRK